MFVSYLIINDFFRTITNVTANAINGFLPYFAKHQEKMSVCLNYLFDFPLPSVHYIWALALVTVFKF